MIVRFEKNKIELERWLKRNEIGYYGIEKANSFFCPDITTEQQQLLCNEFDTACIEMPQNKFVLASRQFKGVDTIVDISGQQIGGEKPVVIAGPCSVESADQLNAIAAFLQRKGVCFLRGGAFKPRTSPYDFQGLGHNGLKLLKDAKEKFGLCIVTEVMDISDIDAVAEVADIIQVGSRNMFNYSLLKALGKVKKPILLKRGMAASVTEFLLSAEYILAAGNSEVILCERGIKTFVPETRNTLDLNAVALIKQISHLPVIVDPSHGTGVRSLVTPMSKAGLACGACGIEVEVHNNPECALSDGEQSLTFELFEQLLNEIK